MAVYLADTTTGDLDDDPKEQFIYHNAGLDGYGSSSYIDAVILRDRDANSSGGSGDWAAEADGTLEERRYYAQNWRHDVVAIVTAAGVMAEQVRYSAYGVPFGLPQGDVDGDGTVDGADQSILFGAWGVTYDVRADINLDGAVDGADNAYVTGNWNTTLGWDALSEDPDDGVGNRKGYAGYEHDPTLAASWTLYHVRHRVYNADLGRWTRRDPLGNVDGSNLFEYVQSMAPIAIDPYGLAAELPPQLPQTPKRYIPAKFTWDLWDRIKPGWRNGMKKCGEHCAGMSCHNLWRFVPKGQACPKPSFFGSPPPKQDDDQLPFSPIRHLSPGRYDGECYECKRCFREATYCMDMCDEFFDYMPTPSAITCCYDSCLEYHHCPDPWCLMPSSPLPFGRPSAPKGTDDWFRNIRDILKNWKYWKRQFENPSPGLIE